MVKITCCEKGSKAWRIGIRAGDELISINGNEISDVLDYRFYLTEEVVKITFTRGKRSRTKKIKKGEYEDIGLGFETPLMDKKHSCTNKCIFCFIDQNPEGLRDTLYFKDDDSRLSFIHGNYITLTNMTDKDVARIVKMRFSPINISVHTTNPELRVKMMRNKHSGDVLRYLSDFANAGLTMCGQVVLCKGVNDGEELLRTMRDLSKFYPQMSNVAIVPAGLTKFRDKLYPLTDFTKEEASAVIDMIDSVAEAHKAEFGSRMFFAADEFYLKAEREIPNTEYYEEYPQIENGVGLIRSFSDEFSVAVEDLVELSSRLTEKRRVALVTGVAAYPTIKAAAERIEALAPMLKIDVYEIINHFFGESITVAGLLTGKDIYEQLAGRLSCDELLIPAAALRREEEDFLCGMTLTELSQKLGVKVGIAGGDGFEFLESVFGCGI